MNASVNKLQIHGIINWSGLYVLFEIKCVNQIDIRADLGQAMMRIYHKIDTSVSQIGFSVDGVLTVGGLSGQCFHNTRSRGSGGYFMCPA